MYIQILLVLLLIAFLGLVMFELWLVQLALAIVARMPVLRWVLAIEPPHHYPPHYGRWPRRWFWWR